MANQVQIAVNEAIVLNRETGSFLISSSGRTLVVTHKPIVAFQAAIDRRLKVVNTTSQKGQAILARLHEVVIRAPKAF